MTPFPSICVENKHKHQGGPYTDFYLNSLKCQYQTLQCCTTKQLFIVSPEVCGVTGQGMSPAPTQHFPNLSQQPMESLHGLTLDFQGSSQKHFLPFEAPANTNPHLKEQRICSAALPLRDPSIKALIFHRDTEICPNSCTL